MARYVPTPEATEYTDKQLANAKRTQATDAVRSVKAHFKAKLDALKAEGTKEAKSIAAHVKEVQDAIVAEFKSA